ncbi:hypothetical protein WISP_142787 [Willisornis vidua]|uniref:Uncharacterized protein n=1 Tax=Willisornis vidua TaxID=1566151 RepID=A0ABQ9CLL2_9PASS|nr:hypothetical protein WISP_142787 [Willisornis vidua]
MWLARPEAPKNKRDLAYQQIGSDPKRRRNMELGMFTTLSPSAFTKPSGGNGRIAIRVSEIKVALVLSLNHTTVTFSSTQNRRDLPRPHRTDPDKVNSVTLNLSTPET